MGGAMSRKKSGKRNDDLRIGTSTDATTSGNKKGFFRWRRKRAATSISPVFVPTHTARASVPPPRRPPSPVPSSSSEHSEKPEINILDDPNMWFYIDTNGREQGPFSTEQMQYWHGRRFLPSDLKTRQATSPVFAPFADLFLGFLSADQAQQRPSVSFSTAGKPDAPPSSPSPSLPSSSSLSSPPVKQQPHSPPSPSPTPSSSSSSLASSSHGEPQPRPSSPEEQPEDQPSSSSESSSSASSASRSRSSSLSSSSSSSSSSLDDDDEVLATPHQSEPPAITQPKTAVPPPSLSTPSLVLPTPQPFLSHLSVPQKIVPVTAPVTVKDVAATTTITPAPPAPLSISEQAAQPIQKSISESFGNGDYDELQVDLQKWVNQQPSAFNAATDEQKPTISASVPNLSARHRSQTEFVAPSRLPVAPPRPAFLTAAATATANAANATVNGISNSAPAAATNENDADLDNFFKTVSILQIEEKPSYRHSMMVLPLPHVHQHSAFRPQRPAPPPPSTSVSALPIRPIGASTPNRPPPQRPTGSYIC